VPADRQTDYVRAKPQQHQTSDADLSDEKKEATASQTIAVDEIDLDTYNAGGFPLVGTPTSFISKMKLFNRRYTSIRMFGKLIYRPLLLFRFPVVLWSGFAYGASLVWYNVLNATASLILTGVPYEFRASFVGLMYLAPLCGAALS
jgi:hypothetical protein